jgi:dihydrofolate reductase
LAEYWPIAIPKTTMPRNPGEEHPFIIEKMNILPKIILSKTLDEVEWKNSMLIKENVKEEILRLKHQPGKDLVLFGGANIASALLRLGLIDEYRIILNPVILSNGNPFFKDIRDKLSLKLLGTKAFDCGNVLLYYQPV